MRNENDTNQASAKAIAVIPSHVGEQNKTVMKINKASKVATARKPLSAATAGKVSKKAQAAKTTVAVKIQLPNALKWTPAIAILTGERGILARQIETATDKATKRVFVRATKDENGLRLRDASVCEVVNGVLMGDKAGRVQMGGYVNGRNTGAKITLAQLADFVKKSAPCIVHWNADDNGIHGRYVGNPHEKGICAVAVEYGKGNTFVWQMERDANSNNKHERGSLKPLDAKKPLAIVGW